MNKFMGNRSLTAVAVTYISLGSFASTLFRSAGSKGYRCCNNQCQNK